MSRRYLQYVSRTFAIVAALSAGSAALTSASPAVQLAERIDLDLKEAKVADVFASFGHVLGGLEVVVPESVGERKIELTLYQVRTVTVLDAICQSVECEWAIEGEPGDQRLVVTDTAEDGSNPSPEEASDTSSLDEKLDELEVSLALVDMNLASMAKALGNVAGLRILVSPALGDPSDIAIALEDAPLREVLDEICLQAGCSWRVIRGSGPKAAIVFEPL